MPYQYHQFLKWVLTRAHVERTLQQKTIKILLALTAKTIQQATQNINSYMCMHRHVGFEDICFWVTCCIAHAFQQLVEPLVATGVDLITYGDSSVYCMLSTPNAPPAPITAAAVAGTPRPATTGTPPTAIGI